MEKDDSVELFVKISMREWLEGFLNPDAQSEDYDLYRGMIGQGMEYLDRKRRLKRIEDALKNDEIGEDDES